MLYNILTSIYNGIRTFASDASNYLKCRSMCCNNINIYNPKTCSVQGDTNILNRLARVMTPLAESPVRKDTAKFYTPKNSE